MSPPFEHVAEGRIAFAKFLEVIARLNRISEDSNNVCNHKPPFVVMDGAADLLPLEQSDVGFWVLAGVIHGLFFDNIFQRTPQTIKPRIDRHAPQWNAVS